MKKYILQDREAGNVINTYPTLQDAERDLKDYETQDKRNNEYTPDFYEIKEYIPASTLTENQKTLLQEIIFQKLIESDDIGLGELGECTDEAERIVEEWAEKANITFID